jgi:hypothetical protein
VERQGYQVIREKLHSGFGTFYDENGNEKLIFSLFTPPPQAFFFFALPGACEWSSEVCSISLKTVSVRFEFYKFSKVVLLCGGIILRKHRWTLTKLYPRIALVEF